MLIKSVIQVIPTYTMSCFKLPKGLIKDLEILICKFWWGFGGDSRKVHLVKWDKLCEAKEVGVWVSRKLKNSMTLYLPNKCGV